jgi:NAD(P)H-dependent FMN reductase
LNIDPERTSVLQTSLNGRPFVMTNADSVLRESPIRLLGIGGSTRQGSKSLILLRAALQLAEAEEATIELADVRSLALPVYDEDRPLADYPATLPALLAAARQADAYVLCSPTYHGTVSGAVKNALDTLNFLGNGEPRYFGGKPVALMALGGGGAANVLTSLQHATRGLNGVVIPTVVIAGSHAVSDGAVTDEIVKGRLRWMVDELLELARRLRRAAPVLTAMNG